MAIKCTVCTSILCIVCPTPLTAKIFLSPKGAPSRVWEPMSKYDNLLERKNRYYTAQLSTKGLQMHTLFVVRLKMQPVTFHQAHPKLSWEEPLVSSQPHIHSALDGLDMFRMCCIGAYNKTSFVTIVCSTTSLHNWSLRCVVFPLCLHNTVVYMFQLGKSIYSRAARLVSVHVCKLSERTGAL